MDERPRYALFGALAVIGLLLFVAVQATPAKDPEASFISRVVSLFMNPEPAPAPSKDVFGPVDAWFKEVSGLSLTQILYAIWRAFIWIFKWVLALAWSLLAWTKKLVG